MIKFEGKDTNFLRNCCLIYGKKWGHLQNPVLKI